MANKTTSEVWDAAWIMAASGEDSLFNWVKFSKPIYWKYLETTDGYLCDRCSKTGNCRGDCGLTEAQRADCYHNEDAYAAMEALEQ